MIKTTFPVLIGQLRTEILGGEGGDLSKAVVGKEPTVEGLKTFVSTVPYMNVLKLEKNFFLRLSEMVQLYFMVYPLWALVFHLYNSKDRFA